MTPEEEEEAFRQRWGTSSGTPYSPEASDNWPAWKVWANNAIGFAVWVGLASILIGAALWISSFPWTHFLPWP